MGMRFEIELDIPADRAWAAVAEQFGETGQWTSLLTSSHMVGSVEEGGHRVCLVGDNRQTEHITHYDPAAMDLRYELIEGRPRIVKSGANRWTVEPIGSGRSRATMTPHVVLHWWARPIEPFMRLGLNASLRKVMEEFKHWAETGEAHPRKQAQMANLATRG